MAEAVVSFVVERVGDLIIQQGRSLAGVGDQVTRAHTDLLFIKGFLKDADAKRRDSEAIRIFVAKIRDAAYDLEDVIETFVLKVESKRNKEGIKKILTRFGRIFIEGVRLHVIGSEIGVINTTISDLKRSLETYGLIIRESGGSSTSMQLPERQQQLRRTYSHVVERNVVGLEESAYELVMRLTKEEYHHHRVVSIWGMGGLGKTTLARQVYHHKEVKRHFECFAWVSISQQDQVRDVLERIYVKLISATDEERKKIARLKDDELLGRLSCVQNERKCLIVLDDMWKTETWDFLKAAFECDETSKSKILLTTRNQKVALHSDVNGFRYQPPPLNETESWELFEKIAMCGRDDAIGKNLGSCRQRAQRYSVSYVVQRCWNGKRCRLHAANSSKVWSNIQVEAEWAHTRATERVALLFKPHLVLSNCCLKDDQMTILEKLTSLKSLELVYDVFGENTRLLVFSNGSFPRLQFLTLARLDGIREWRVEEGAMPSLCRLVIIACRRLSRVPDGVRQLTTLKELEIAFMPREFCRKVEQGGDHFHKIQHVPSLVIRNQLNW